MKRRRGLFGRRDDTRRMMPATRQIWRVNAANEGGSAESRKAASST
jgi:hypothetical protein